MYVRACVRSVGADSRAAPHPSPDVPLDHINLIPRVCSPYDRLAGCLAGTSRQQGARVSLARVSAQQLFRGRSASPVAAENLRSGGRVLPGLSLRFSSSQALV